METVVLLTGNRASKEGFPTEWTSTENEYFCNRSAWENGNYNKCIKIQIIPEYVKKIKLFYWQYNYFSVFSFFVVNISKIF